MKGEKFNYDLPEPINMIGYIESKKGTMRANHFHQSKSKNVC